MYKIVDSWRSYRDDPIDLQSQSGHASCVLNQQQQQVYQSDPQDLTASAPSFQPSQSRRSHFVPYQPLRLVRNYARYPKYRVNKPYRTSDGTRERQIVQQAQTALQVDSTPSTSRYTFRPRPPDQIAPFSSAVAADVPLPSVESSNNFLPLSFSQHNSIRQFSTIRDRTASPEVESPPAPTASAEYKKNSQLPPALRQVPQKLLVILDLNGTLLVRPKKNHPTRFIMRPGVTRLLDYLFKHHVVMVYSSARPVNTTAMVQKLIRPAQRIQMAGVWARDKLDLTKDQYNAKVQVYKKLQKIWADNSVQARAEPGRKWDQSNTVLVDDSQLKALAQPHNLLQVPEFENDAPKRGGPALRDWQLHQQEIVKSVEQKLEELKWQVDVSRLIRHWQTGKRHAPGVVDETVDQKTHRSVQDQVRSPSPSLGVGQDDSSPPQHLTPKSPSPSDSDADSGPGGGVAVDDSITSSLDGLEMEIDRHLNIQESVRRSESPINESVWSEILAGGKANDKGGEKGKVKAKHKRRGKKKNNKVLDSMADVPPTPDSMDA